MPIGPGKYDKWCQDLLLELQADGVILLVLNGVLGGGFSVNTTSVAMMKKLPEFLRQMADEIERSM